MANHLEQLVAEWLEHKGYFVRRNVKVGKLSHGGFEGELDIVAYHPINIHLLHIEPSIDAHTWEKREQRFQKKFDAGRKYIIADIFPWLPHNKTDILGRYECKLLVYMQMQHIRVHNVASNRNT